MGLADKIQSKISGNKQVDDLDKAGGKLFGKESLSGEVQEGYKRGDYTKENAAKYGDEYDQKAGKLLGKENLSGTDGGAGTKFFGDKKDASASTSADKKSSGKDALSGAVADKETSGKEALSNSTGYDQKVSSSGTHGLDSSKATGAAAAGTAGATGAAAGTAYAKNDSTGKDSYGSSGPSSGYSGKDTYNTGSAVTGDHSTTARGTDIPGTQSYTAGSSGKDSYGNPTSSNYAAKDSYGTSGAGANTAAAVTGDHSTTARGTDIPGTESYTAKSSGKDSYGASALSSGHGKDSYGASAPSTGAAVTGDHSTTARGNDLPGTGSYTSGTSGKHTTSGTGASGAEKSGHSSSSPSSGILGGFTTGDHSLDQKIAKLDTEGQTKAKEAFERGYQDAIKQHSK